MRILMFVALISFGFLSGAAQARDITFFGSGNIKCRDSQMAKFPRQEQWVLGFLSGLAFGSGKDLLGPVSIEFVESEVLNNCRTNPDEALERAALRLGMELQASEPGNR